MVKREPSVDYLKRILSYDPNTGVFRWLVSRNRNKAGDVAGCLAENKPGHVRIQIGIDRDRYKAHRLAWLMHYGDIPDLPIDHINRDATDNRIANLRIATHQQNMANSKRRSHNTNKYKGVEFMTLQRGKKRWRARITVDRKNLHLGYFETPEQAHAAYVKAAIAAFGEFASSGE